MSPSMRMSRAISDLLAKSIKDSAMARAALPPLCSGKVCAHFINRGVMANALTAASLRAEMPSAAQPLWACVPGRPHRMMNSWMLLQFLLSQRQLLEKADSTCLIMNAWTLRKSQKRLAPSIAAAGLTSLTGQDPPPSCGKLGKKQVTSTLSWGTASSSTKRASAPRSLSPMRLASVDTTKRAADAEMPNGWPHGWAESASGSEIQTRCPEAHSLTTAQRNEERPRIRGGTGHEASEVAWE